MRNTNHIAYYANREIWGGTQLVGLAREDRQRHLFCIGQTGCGKSTLLANLFLDDVHNNLGCGVIDVHGDLAQELLARIPKWRSRDVIYLDAADREFPIGLNFLRNDGPDSVPLVASSIVSAFKNIWIDSWGPRLEYYLYAALAALAECENTTLLGVPRLFNDDQYRDWVLRQVSDPVVKAFWVNYSTLDKRFLVEATAPIENKIGKILMSPLIRLCCGQVRQAINIRKVMDEGKILICNFSKGKLGEDKACLLASLFVAQFQQAALSRSNIPPDQRVGFTLYADEFSSYVNESFSSILSESRKYGLHLALFTQHMASVPQEVQQAILGNVANIVSFRIGETDARVMEREFGGEFLAGQFTDLANFEVLVKCLQDGRYPKPFHATTLPPQGAIHGRHEKLIRQSRQRYATPRAVVEDRIRRWMGVDSSLKEFM
jgi:hypothetical protein